MAAEYWGSVIHGPFLVCTLKKALVEVFREEGENVAFHWLKTINSCIYDRKSFHGIHRYAVRPPKTEDQVRQYIDDILCPVKGSPSIPGRILHRWYEGGDSRTNGIRLMYLEDRLVGPGQWLKLLELDDVIWFSTLEHVHHDNPDCPHGKRIREDPDQYDNWTDGTGGLPLCEECQRLDSP